MNRLGKNFKDYDFLERISEIFLQQSVTFSEHKNSKSLNFFNSKKSYSKCEEFLKFFTRAKSLLGNTRQIFRTTLNHKTFMSKKPPGPFQIIQYSHQCIPKSSINSHTTQGLQLRTTFAGIMIHSTLSFGLSRNISSVNNTVEIQKRYNNTLCLKYNLLISSSQHV